MRFSPHCPARSEGVKLQSASASLPNIRAKSAVPMPLLPGCFAWAGSAAFFFSKPGALLEPKQQNVFTSQLYCGHCLGSEALGSCGSPPGNRMHYALRLVLNSSTPWRNSAATETRRVMSLRTVIEIDDPALSRRVNRVEVRSY